MYGDRDNVFYCHSALHVGNDTFTTSTEQGLIEHIQEHLQQLSGVTEKLHSAIERLKKEGGVN